MTNKAYTPEQTKEIIKVFVNTTNNPEERKQLAEKLGRNLSSLEQKASKWRQKNGIKLRKYKTGPKVAKKETIQVTHINKPVETINIQIGEAKVSFISNKFKVNGIEIDC